MSRFLHAGASGAPAGLVGGAGAPNLTRQVVSGVTSAAAAHGAAELGADPGTQAAVALAVGAGAAAARIPQRMQRAPKVSPPGKDALADAASAAYKRAEDASVVVKPGGFAAARNRIAASLAQEGLDPTLHPSTTAAVKRVMDADGPLTLKQLETLRRVAKSAESSIHPPDRRLAAQLVDDLDEFVDTLGPADVDAGDPVAAIPALREARGLWARKRKTDTIDELVHRAELSAPNFSGSGMENALRTEFRALAKNARRMRTFAPEEQAAIERVAQGGPLENTLRMLGKLAPTGAVSTAISSGAGFLAGGPAGAIGLPTAGLASRYAATRMTQGNVRRAQELMRRGPPDAAPVPDPLAPPSVPALPAPGASGELQLRDFALTPSLVAGAQREPLLLTAEEPVARPLALPAPRPGSDTAPPPARAGATAVAEAPAAIRSLVERVAANPSDNTRVLIPYAEQTHPLAVEAFKKAGLDVAGYTHVVDNFAIRHVLKNHGSAETELPRGQLPITADDVAMLPEVIRAPDDVRYDGKTAPGRESVIYTKRVNGHLLLVEEARTGRKELAVVSMRKVARHERVPGGKPSSAPNARNDGGTLPHAWGNSITGRPSRTALLSSALRGGPPNTPSTRSRALAAALAQPAFLKG